MAETTNKAVSISHEFATFSELWSPRLVAAVNDQHVKIAKIDGAFIWHAHTDSDELFYLFSGKLTLEIWEQDPVIMQEGDIWVVPKGVKHRPVAENAHIMMVEHVSTVNTGDQHDSEKTKKVVDVRS
jgi:quercetin dioxygenase-like cupin family protein